MSWSIVCATQFHEFVVGMFTTAPRWHLVPLPRARLQTVAAADVAQTVADAEQSPRYGRISVAVPEVMDVRDLAGIWRSIIGRATLQVPIVLRSAAGAALRAGVLTSDRPEVCRAIPFAAAC